MKDHLHFLVGLAFGIGIGWVGCHFAMRKTLDKAYKETESVKETFTNALHAAQERYEKANAPAPSPEAEQENDISEADSKAEQEREEKKTALEEMMQYNKKIRESGYTDYSRTVARKEKEKEPEEMTERTEPYIITAFEFGEKEGYGSATLLFFSDGVLTDEFGGEVGNDKELVGSTLGNIEDMDEDALYIRNDVRHCDYEILIREDSYEEFRDSSPNGRGN